MDLVGGGLFIIALDYTRRMRDEGREDGGGEEEGLIVVLFRFLLFCRG